MQMMSIIVQSPVQTPLRGRSGSGESQGEFGKVFGQQAEAVEKPSSDEAAEILAALMASQGTGIELPVIPLPGANGEVDPEVLPEEGARQQGIPFAAVDLSVTAETVGGGEKLASASEVKKGATPVATPSLEAQQLQKEALSQAQQPGTKVVSPSSREGALQGQMAAAGEIVVEAVGKPKTTSGFLSVPQAGFAPAEGTGGKSLEGISEARFASLLRAKPVEGQGTRENAPTPLLDPALQGAAEENASLEAGAAVLSSGEPMEGEVGEMPIRVETAPLNRGEVFNGNPGAQPRAAEVQTAEQGVVRLPSGTVVPERQIVEQVVTRFDVAKDHPGGSISLRMHPEELGKVRLDLTMDHDRVKAHLVAQSQQVQEVLERNLPKLRDALEQQGLKLENLQVSVDSQGDGGRSHFQQSHRQRAFNNPFARAEHTAAADLQRVPGPGLANAGGLSLRI